VRCGRARENLSLYLLGELDAAARAEVEAHLAGCPACAEELESLRRLTATLDEALASVSASPALQKRIMTEVKATPLPRRVRQSRVPIVPEAEDEREHLMQRRATGQLILAAAVILLLVVIWLVAPRREGGPDEGGLIAKTARVERVNFEVTVHNDDLALVRDVCRLTNLQRGLNEVRFEDVPTAIDPTSVTFRSKTDPAGTTVLDQNYEYDLATPEKILSRYIDRRIETVSKRGDVAGGYLSGFDSGQLVLTSKPGEGKTSMLSRERLGAIRLERLPDGLLTRPTLVWKVRARKAGDHETVVSYLTGGMKWHCNYILVRQPANKADLKAWVTIENRSGAGYPRAKLKLMAGDLHRVNADILNLHREWDTFFLDDDKDGGPGFTEKAFFEYHLYTLGRETDLRDNSVKQIELTAAAGIGTTTQYVFEGGPKVAVYLTFKNEKENGLGIPLPKGVVRVMQEDSDGSLEFLGEDEIDHTPKDEEIKVLTGHAFDLVGERKVLSDRTVGRSRRATVQVKLRNHKATPVTITVRERIDHDWRITKTSHQFKKVDAHTVEFEVPVAPNKESVLTFSYVATW